MKLTALLIVAGVFAICLAGTCSFTYGKEFADLVKHVPDTANALVLVDAQSLFNSPVAKRGNWQASRESRFSAGLTSLPPKAGKMILGANIDVDLMAPTWEVAVVEMETETLMSTLAERSKGVLDTLSNRRAIRLPDDSFVLEFSDGTLGAMAPGNRQQVSQWINHVNRGPSSYLEQGIHYADANAQVIMLLDLQDAFAAHELDLEKLESVQKSKVDKAELNKLIASVKGVMLGITFRDKLNARLKVDFGADATFIAEMAKPLILDIIGSYGVMLDELADWKLEVKGKTVFLGGALTSSGLSRLATLTRLPTSALQHTDAPAATTVAATDEHAEKPNPVETTKKYYQSVTTLVESLRELKSDMKTMGQLAQWFENYGRRVDDLPTLGVDPEMLEFGAYISSQLHGAAMGLKGVTIQKNVDQNVATNNTRIYGGALGNISQYGWQQGSYGGNYGRRMETNAAYGIARSGGVAGAINSDLRQQQQAQTAVRIQAKATAATGVQQISQNIQTATTQIRQSMTAKYQVQF